MKPTVNQLATIRSRPHSSQWWLSIYQPEVVLTCQVNDATIINQPPGAVIAVPYDSVSAGSYLSVESGMTMYVGTTPRGGEKGRVRVRSATDGLIYIAESSHIDWADDDYLYIVRYWEIWPVYPRLVQNGTRVTFYKDYDVAYTDQNEVFGVFHNMGPHHAGFLDCNTDEMQVYYSASGTYHVLSSAGLHAMTYDWAFEGGTPTGSTNAEPGYVIYDTPGHYTTRLIVTDDNNVSETSYRHVSVYDKPSCGGNIPPLEWGILSLDGDRDGGGWRARIWMREDASYVKDGMLVTIFADPEEYGSTQTSIGGNALNRDSIIFNGYILNGSIEYNYRESRLEFDVGSPTEVMKAMESFSVSVESKKNPRKWYHLLDMDVRRAIHHYLRWHSTALLCNDFEFRGDDHPIQYFDADRTSLYDSIRTLMENSLRGQFVCDLQGKMWAEVDTGAVHDAATALQKCIDLSDTDWMGTISIDERRTNDISFIEIGGIAYSGVTTGTSTALLAVAPGDAPGYGGSVERTHGLALLGQSQLNDLAGDQFAWKNARYPNVTVNLAGNYRIFDIVPQEVVGLTVASDDTPMGISWTNKAFVTRQMSIQYDSARKVVLPTIYLHEIPSGKAGLSQAIPVEPPDDGWDDPPDPPDVPPPPLPPPGVPPNTIVYVAGSWTAAGDPGDWTSFDWANDCLVGNRDFWGLTGSMMYFKQTGVYMLFASAKGTTEILLDIYICHNQVFKQIGSHAESIDHHYFYNDYTDENGQTTVSASMPIFINITGYGLTPRIKGTGYGSFCIVKLGSEYPSWSCWQWCPPPGGG